MSKYINKDGTIRLYDGTGTPYYLELNFDNGDFSAPIGTPRPDEVLVLSRQKMDSNAHYIEGSDEKLMEPVTASFSFFMEDTGHTKYLLDWLYAMNDGGTTTINSNTITTTKSDTQRDGATNNPAFADSNKLTCNIEIRWNVNSAIKFVYNEVYFPLEQLSLSESEDGVDVTLSGMVYGTIVPSTSAFTSGTDVTA